uniref:Uncharacterized protein n=1 Tax=Parastrongyloides trichosuri TaxID=131310 RepID=A0A0N4Z7R2_PARTI
MYKKYLFAICLSYLLTNVNCCMSSKPTDPPVVPTSTTISPSTSTTTSTTTSPTTSTTTTPTTSTTTTPTTSTTTTTTTVSTITSCVKKDNKVNLYVDPSVAGSENAAIGGSKTGTACDVCANTKYFDPATNSKFTGTGAINTYSCPTGKPLCLCDATKCYKETADTVSVTLYPYCTSATDCNVYGIIDAQKDTDGVAGANGVAVWTPANTLDSNFDFLPVTTANTYMKVSAISCGTCPIAVTSTSCLPTTLTMA